MKKKLVFTSDLSDDKLKQKALKTIVGLLGVDSVAMDKKAKKLTVTGDIDPVHLVMKMRKVCFIAIVSVGPAQEPHEKKEEPREEEPKEREGDDVSEFVKVYPAYKERPQSLCYLLIYFI